ncbi:MAG: copper-containing nitrite reductase [Actinomycetota bacterium]
MFGIFLVIAAIMTFVAVDLDNDLGTQVGRSSELKLTPKADLPVIETREGANWTHAPAVPPRIERSGQARLVVNWTANEFTIALDPENNLRYAAWGFEGHTPGPILRARVGDLIEVNLTNDARATHPHNIDFHFATGPGGGATALSVSPGQTAKVEVRALQPGIYMYHCATPDIPTHIANGMYGYVIVEPQDGLPEVDKEFYVVQSEFYAKGNRIATLDAAKLDAEEPNYVVLNGAVGSLMGTNSPKVKVGDRVRIWYGNAGPQLISSFHVIGEIFDRVYREGDLVSAPAQAVQTTLVPAGGATAVEFTVDVPGTYLLLDHAIARSLHKGTVGAIVAEGDANTEVFEPGASNPPGPPGGDGHGGGQPIGETMVSMTKGAFDPKNAANAFSPNTVEIKVGESVMWMNSDDVAHTATAEGKAFDSGFVNPGQSFSFTFTKAGTFSYFCTPHPWMKGTVVVSEE